MVDAGFGYLERQLGFPDRSTTLWRLTTFVVNIVTILLASLAVYIALRYQPQTIRRYTRLTRG